jgi:hypothetical protein
VDVPTLRDDLLKDIEAAYLKVQTRVEQLYKTIVSAAEVALARDAGGNERGALLSMKRYRMARAMYEHLRGTVSPTLLQLESDVQRAGSLIKDSKNNGQPNVDVTALWATYRLRLEDQIETAKAAPLAKLSTSNHGEDVLGTEALLAELRLDGGSFLDDFVELVKGTGKGPATKLHLRSLVRKRSDLSNASFNDSFSADTFLGDFEDYQEAIGEDDSFSDEDQISDHSNNGALEDDDDSIVVM